MPRHHAVPPTPGELALMDQTNALLDEIIDQIEHHWPSCELTEEYCIGNKAVSMIVGYATASQNHLKALLFLSIIRAARQHRQIETPGS